MVTEDDVGTDNNAVVLPNSATIDSFSQRAILDFPALTNAVDDRETDVDETNIDRTDLQDVVGDDPYGTANFIVIDFPNGYNELLDSLINPHEMNSHGFNFLNYDVGSLSGTAESLVIMLDKQAVTTIDLDGSSNYINVFGDDPDSYTTTGDTEALFDGDGGFLQLRLNFADLSIDNDEKYPIVLDFFSFGFENDGEASDERIANQIIRLLLEESGDNTASLEGTLEYIMINQLNIDDLETYQGLTTIDDEVSFIVIEDLTGSSAPSVTYLDRDATNSQVQVSAQEDAPSHSAVVSLSVDSFKAGDTVTVTLEDLDLNVDSGLVDIYTVVDNIGNANHDAVGEEAAADPDYNVELGRLLDITFDDQRWQNYDNACADALDGHKGLGDTNFSLTETGDATGIFVGTFPLPAEFCRDGVEATPESITGVDIEVNYVDFRDASGETTEVGDSAGVKASTGSVSLDRTVYPVPFGITGDFETTTSTTPSQNNNVGRSLFPIHQSGMSDDPLRGLDSGEFLPQGDLIVYVTVTDPDYDVSASGQDSIAEENAPVTVTIIRGSDREMVAEIGDRDSPIDEIAPDAGIFESSVTIRYNDGPESSICPDTPISVVFDADRISTEPTSPDADNPVTKYLIDQGDEDQFTIDAI